MKKYEIALLYDSYDYKNVKTYELDTMKELQEYLKSIIENADANLYKIELSILDQDENGDNLNAYIFCEVNVKELNREV